MHGKSLDHKHSVVWVCWYIEKGREEGGGEREEEGEGWVVRQGESKPDAYGKGARTRRAEARQGG